MLTPETNLNKLLANMQPELAPGVYVFATLPASAASAHQPEAWGWMREREGVTLILPRPAAEAAGLDYAFPARLITLTIHSSLEAVGFLAVITEALAAAEISVNAVSAYYHDHLFVPFEKADQAMAVLAQLGGKGANDKTACSGSL